MIEQILSLMIGERDKIDRALEALGANAPKRRGRPFGSRNQKKIPEAVAAVVEPPPAVEAPPRKWSAAARRAQSKRVQAQWADRRKQAAA